jgi:hypothetical protein
MHIPVKEVCDAFKGMSAPHRDCLTWELLRDITNIPLMANLLKKFIVLFVSGQLPKPLWKILSSTITKPFHKLALMERDLLLDPRLHPITIGTLMAKFGCQTTLRMKRRKLAKRMLLLN